MHGLVPEWTFADRLRKARLTSHLTQEEFADRLGAKPGAYSHWEAGRNTPRQVVSIAQRIEMLTGIPAAWMLGLADPSPQPGPGTTANPRTKD
ncbi:helix-turn-helix domain-containing protein [Arthrobacter sp. HLT1-20]